ncbi:RNA-binding protein 42-like isoform X1 [Dreissena polymorpha]|uniref:RNA-binding protein 42-like isoform X1 n=1 Tax=Dreissena polymorpha TaxID=45954 RepID=UPI002265492E|nr:RNA-binding protein 42-like isoform X1 [Dreissena polymorpha]
MSGISHQRLLEMEAEMDRFEAEIVSEPAANDLPRVIGSHTYHEVSAQLKLLRAQSGMSDEECKRTQQQIAGQLKALREASERQARRVSEEEEEEEDADKYNIGKASERQARRVSEEEEEEEDADKYNIVGRNEPPAKKPMLDPSISMLPPPPPPPIMSAPTPTPSFVPHQIRHRAPPPPPPPSHPGGPGGMSGPPGAGMRMRPPPPPPQHMQGRPPFGGPHGPMHGGPQHGGPGPGFHPGMGPMRPMGPGGPMRMPGPPRPGFMHGPPTQMGGGGPMNQSPMYGVSSGQGQGHMENVPPPKKEEEKPRVIYASAPVLTVPLKEKKKKKKKGDKDGGSKEEKDKSGEGHSETAGPSLPSSLASYTITMPPPVDNMQVADMELDGTAIPTKKERKKKEKKFVRMAAGTTWEDQSLSEWDPDDFRVFCGDLGNEVTDEVLSRAFNKYSSFVKAKVVRDKRSNKTKGYGFVSFKDPNDYVRAMREMNGKYVGNRPIKLRKSNWKERNIEVVKKKDREKKRLGLK